MNEPTAEELRKVARWLCTIGYHSAAGQCHRRAWQLEGARDPRDHPYDAMGDFPPVKRDAAES